MSWWEKEIRYCKQQNVNLTQAKIVTFVKFHVFLQK